MYRLAEYEENPELFEYLSAIASETIDDALDQWVFSTPSARLLYDCLDDNYSSNGQKSFFHGLHDYLSISKDTCQEETECLDLDEIVGVDLIYRKAKRMREKLMDKDKYYVFDLFEEYILRLLVSCSWDLEDDNGVDEDVEEQIIRTAHILTEQYGKDPDLAEEIARCVWYAGQMDGDIDLIFWDHDFATIFEDGFVPGIQKLVGGMGQIMGYSYDDVCEIFTGAGLKAPILLVGTKAAYDTMCENVQQTLEDRARQGISLLDDFSASVEDDLPDSVADDGDDT